MAGNRRVIVADDSDRNGSEIDDHTYVVRTGSDRTRELDQIREASNDPFAISLEDAKALSGVSPTVKKRITRDLEKRHTGIGNAGSKKNETEEVGAYNLFSVVLPPYNLEYLAKLYTISTPNYGAIQAKTANIVGLGYDLVDSQTTRELLDKTEDEKKLAAIRRKLQKVKFDLFAWLDSCNQDDDFLETMKKVYTDYETTGNGYFEIGRQDNGRIGYIGHVPSVTMRIRKERDGFVQIIGNKMVFFRNFGDKDTTNPLGGDRNPNEVIHIKKYNPLNSYYGIPDIMAATDAVAGMTFSSKFNLDYFENKAVPRYVIVIKGGELGISSQQKIIDFFETSLRGKNHRTLYVPLPADGADRKTSFEMKPVEAGTQDASFVNYHKINLAMILMAHRTPISKVGLAEGVSLAVARDADKTFKEQVCRPEQRILEKKLGRIFAEMTDNLNFKLNELTLTDEDTQSKIDERYLRMQTIVPNEVRARWGWPGLKDGDKPVDLKPQQAAEATAQATGNRQRDQQRTAGSTDSASSTESRAPKGEGRSTS